MHYLAQSEWFLSDKYRAKRWRRNIFQRLAFTARYARTPPSEVLHWEIADLHDFMNATNDILREENKSTKR